MGLDLGENAYYRFRWPSFIHTLLFLIKERHPGKKCLSFINQSKGLMPSTNEVIWTLNTESDLDLETHVGSTRNTLALYRRLCIVMTHCGPQCSN